MFLRKKLFSRLSTHRLLFIGLAALIGVQPILVAVAPNKAVALNKDQQRQYVRFVEQLLQQSTGDQSRAAFTAAAVGPLACMQNKKIIIDANAWLELQGDALVKALSDKAETSFGREVLRQTLQQPTDDTLLIDMRKKQVQALVDDPKLYDEVGKQLRRIKEAEKAEKGGILDYWDESQLENAGSLFYRSKGFYYSMLSHNWLLGKGINNNRRYLEAASLLSMGKIAFELLFYLGLQGVIQDGSSFIISGLGNETSEDGSEIWNLWKSFKTGVTQPYRSFDWRLTEAGEKYNRETANIRTFKNLMDRGSAGDLYKILQLNYKARAGMRLGKPGQAVHEIANWSANNCCFGKGLCGKVAKKVDADGHLRLDEEVHPGCSSPLGTGAHKAVAAGITAGVTVYRFVAMYEMLKSTVGKAKHYVSTMKELHIHTIHMARAMNAMQKLAGMVCDHEVFRASCTAEHMHEVIGHPSEDLKKLFDVLKESTFTLSKAKSHIYARGNVLLAHQMFGKVKDELVPLLQGIGELDAAYAMASNIKARQHSDTPFTFVEFVPDVQATIKLEQAWLPMVKQPVANTITLGGGAHPNKIIITGPNGGGKSVFLKTLGCCVLLAQSWGIVPARKAQMSLFDGVCSCIHPQESIEHELSTFMAEKLRIDAIRQYVFQNNKPGFKGLLLLDEPFKGTVDAESADRIYEFGKEIAPLNGLIVSIATHVEKPINLAPNTGAYANYHVCINELPGGIFERKFTIEPGVLRWWFDDPAKRSKFIDFVTIEKHKEQLKQSAAA